MVWKELIPKIEFLLRRHPPPKFVVIQLGSNDLGTVKGWQLAENIICDILRIHALMPNTPPCLETTSLPAQYTILDPNIQIEREPII
jgi:lysophospholipase L1-like esterase